MTDPISQRSRYRTDLYDVLLGTMKNGRTVDPSGRFTQLEPVMRRNGESWLIQDIYRDGPISEVATRRSGISHYPEERWCRRPDRCAEPQGNVDRDHGQRLLALAD